MNLSKIKNSYSQFQVIQHEVATDPNLRVYGPFLGLYIVLSIIIILGNPSLTHKLEGLAGLAFMGIFGLEVMVACVKDFGRVLFTSLASLSALLTLLANIITQLSILGVIYKFNIDLSSMDWETKRSLLESIVFMVVFGQVIINAVKR